MAALVVFGGGLLIGHAVCDDGSGDRAVRRPPTPAAIPSAATATRSAATATASPTRSAATATAAATATGATETGTGTANGNGGGATNTSTAFLGVGVANSTDPAGVRVVNVVASGPAAGAGLQRGDVITAVDGKAVANMAALRAAVGAHQPGDDVKVTYTRNGSEKTVTVSLGDRPRSASSPRPQSLTAITTMAGRGVSAGVDRLDLARRTWRGCHGASACWSA